VVVFTIHKGYGPGEEHMEELNQRTHLSNISIINSLLKFFKVVQRLN